MDERLKVDDVARLFNVPKSSLRGAVAEGRRKRRAHAAVRRELRDKLKAIADCLIHGCMYKTTAPRRICLRCSCPEPDRIKVGRSPLETLGRE